MGPWNPKRTFRLVVNEGDLHAIKWCYENGCVVTRGLIKRVLQMGNLPVLKWMTSLVDQEEWHEEWALGIAAKHGKIEVMVWLREQGVPWSFGVYRKALLEC